MLIFLYFLKTNAIHFMLRRKLIFHSSPSILNHLYIWPPYPHSLILEWLSPSSLQTLLLLGSWSFTLLILMVPSITVHSHIDKSLSFLRFYDVTLCWVFFGLFGHYFSAAFANLYFCAFSTTSPQSGLLNAMCPKWNSWFSTAQMCSYLSLSSY